MEFKALKNIETAYQQLRRYSMVFLGLCALITVVAVWRSYSFAEKQRQKIYVLDNGKSLMLALICGKTAPSKRGNMSNGFTNCSSRWPRIRRLSRAT